MPGRVEYIPPKTWGIPAVGMGELEVTTRFRARSGEENALADAIMAILPPVRKESNCLSVRAYRATEDARLFFITSRWSEDGAYERHHNLPHTRAFLEQVGAMVSEPIASTRMRPLE